MTEYFYIELTQGQRARVSGEDFDELCKSKWFATWSEKTQSFYAARSIRLADGRFTTERMHRVIMGATKGQQIDHKNGDTLDNRRSELRFATNHQNAMNSKLRKNNKSGFKGVSYSASENRWIANICLHGKCKYLGGFDTREEAHAAYMRAAIEAAGEFARAA